MPGFYYSHALLPSRHASFLHLGALHYLPGGLYVFFPPCCPRPSGYRGRLRSAFLFSPRPLLSRGAPLLHGSMTDCLDADEEPCRAFTRLQHSTSPGTLLFLHLGARYYLPGSLYVCFTPCCARQFGRLVIPCIGIPHSFKCAFSGRIYPLVVQYF